MKRIKYMLGFVKTVIPAILLLLMSVLVCNAGTVGYVSITNPTPSFGSVSRSPAGTLVSISGSTSTYSFTKNSGVTLTAVPNSGYQIKPGTFACGGANLQSQTASSCTYYITDGTYNTFSVEFQLVPTVYTVTASVSGSGGTVSPATQSVGEGGTVLVTATPDPGYAVQSISINGGSNTLSQPSYSAVTQSVGPVTSNTTVTASFVSYHLITVTQPANCSILNNGVQPTGGVVKVINGDSTTFTVVPATGANIDQVTYDGTSVGAVTSYTASSVTADHTLTATCSLPTSDILKYTITPPFVSGNITPNLLLMIDNSASMYDMSYDSTGKCYDTSYSTSASYPGYFDEASIYSYNSTTQRFESGASMPASCTFKAADYCVTMAGTKPDRTVSVFVAKGKFLNWLVTSKLDLQKKILTGGKYDTASGTLLSESRGCMGRRFVRIVPNALKVSGSAEDLTGMTFAIRGPTSLEPDYTNPATQGGATRIEIYDSAYNLTSCTAAVVDWTNVTATQLGEVQNSSTDCLACSGSACNGSDILKSETYIHMVHQCYWYYNNHSFANTTTLIKDCENVYDTIALPSSITNELSGEAVCSSVISHPYYTNLPVAGYVANDVGFLGRCVTLTLVTPGQYSYVWDAACLDREMADFCEGMRSSDVTDPSGTGTVTTGTSTSVPSFIMDAGVNALGSIAGTYYANVKLTTAPTGLIQEFKDYIRFGAMVFNQDGSGSECDVSGTNITCAKHCSTTTTTACFVNADCPSGESCVLNTKLDGGKVISYILYDPVGNHASGLIRSIDLIQASAWTPFAEAYYNAIGYFANRTDLRLQTADFDETKNPAVDRCRLNNILIISDGASTADQNASVYSLAANYNDGDGQVDSITSACSYAGSKNLDDLAWLAYNRNIKDFTKTPAQNNQSIKTYVVYNGLAAANATDECLPANLMNQTAKNGGTTSAYVASSYEALLTQMRAAFRAIAGGSASGTAASILSNSEGSGANILQAVFYPLKEFEATTRASWIGEMQNLWYYVDPYIGNSTVREDTDYSGSGDHVLNVKNDYVVQFLFDPTTNDTKAKLYQDTNGDGSGDAVVTNTQDSRVSTTVDGLISADDVRSIWRAGRQLWARDITTSPRKLYTYLAGTTATGCTGSFSKTGLFDLVSFDWNESVTNSCILQKLLNASTQDDAKKIIRYIQGEDGLTIEGMTTRSRSVTIGGVTNVWKLGDIISSTPRVQSSNKLQNYHKDAPVGYGDVTYANDSSNTGFANSTSYKDRGMAFAGANDGMLHAFTMGKLTVQTSGDNKATLSGTDLGKEQWSFIPKHALPYLKYLADPNYNHIYLVDGPSRILDASIGATDLSPQTPYVGTGGCGTEFSGDDVSGQTVTNYWACKRDGSQTDNKSWRTILIGSMGTGGAAANLTSSCSTTTECVKTPINGVGFSSYYALDVTDPANPTFLWDFTADDLGYSTTGAAIVRIAHSFVDSGVTYKDTNGRWFAVIGNGPTGPIDTGQHQFMGTSTNNLKLYVLDLRSGKKIKELSPATTLTKAFVGSIGPGPQDINRYEKLSPSFYSDDAVYAGYTQCTANCDTVTPTWDGGVIRLFTNNMITPKDWDLTTLISGTGPVTSAVSKLQDRKYKKLWLYFGSGRYFFKGDDNARQGKLIGVSEPCFVMDYAFGPAVMSSNAACKNTITFDSSTFVDQTTLQTTPDFTGKNGWFITLGAQDTVNYYGAERVITDPVAMSNGAVFFTTFMPSIDACNFGGKSFIWGVQYNTGGTASTKALQGKALVQVSTGSFEEINLSSALTAEGGRKMATPMTGKPPTDPPPIVSASGNKPLKRIIHVREK